MAHRSGRLPRRPPILCDTGALLPTQRIRLYGFRSGTCVQLIYATPSRIRQNTCGNALAPQRILVLTRAHAPAHVCNLNCNPRLSRNQETTASGNRKKKKRTALNQIGTQVRVNEMDVTLFRMGAILFATQEACQHMGGPLSLGDIEVRGRLRCIVHLTKALLM